MAASNRGSGCGCCGIFSFGVGFLLLVLMAIGVFFYFTSTNNLRKYASHSPAVLPAVETSRQLYISTRQRFDQFFANPLERSLMLSGPEINALLTESPELKSLQRNVVAALRKNSAELTCSLPINFPFFSSYFFNYTLYLRPSLRGENIQLQIYRIDKEGKQLSDKELRQFQNFVVQPANLVFSGWNKFQLNRSIRDIQIDNGNLLISR